MKNFARLFFVSVFAFGPVAAQAGSLSGTLSLQINGTLRGTVSQGGQALCSAGVLLAPSFNGAPTLGNLSSMMALNGGLQVQTAGGVLATTRKGFKCTVNLPYTFSNYAAGQQLIVYYSASGSDNGYFYCDDNDNCKMFPPTYHPTSAHQLLTLPAVPPNGSVTTKVVSVTL